MTSTIGVTAMLTGHRHVANAPAVCAQLVRTLRTLDPEATICGGARGGDTLLAVASDSLAVPFDLFLPNIHYNAYYEPPQRQWLLEHCRHVRYVVDRPAGPDWRARWNAERWWVDNFARNRAMVDAAGVYIAISDHDPRDVVRNRSIKGGTAGAIRDIATHGRRDGDGAVELLWINPARPDETAVIRFPAPVSAPRAGTNR